MATYKKDRNHLIEAPEAQAIMDNLPSPRDKFLVAVLFITGCRPCELAKKMRRRDVTINSHDSHIQITLYTAKRGKVKGFNIPFRTLQVATTSPFIESVIIPYLQTFDDDPERLLIDCSSDRIRQIIYEGSHNTICPYNFRHSRLWRMGRFEGVTDKDLRAWKGGGSTENYLSGKPTRRDLVID